MGWIILLAIVALIAVFAESIAGKIVLGATVLALGLLLLRWITGIAFFVILAKACAVLIVVTVVGALLLALIG